jgi:hypothetical protein
MIKQITEILERLDKLEKAVNKLRDTAVYPIDEAVTPSVKVKKLVKKERKL